MAAILNKRQQSLIAGHAIVKIEDILDEVKKAIRVLYEEEQYYALQSNMDNVFYR